MLVGMFPQVTNSDNAKRYRKHANKRDEREQSEVTGRNCPSRPSDGHKHAQHGIVIGWRRHCRFRNRTPALHADDGLIAYLRTAIWAEHLSELLTRHLPRQNRQWLAAIFAKLGIGAAHATARQANPTVRLPALASAGLDTQQYENDYCAGDAKERNHH